MMFLKLHYVFVPLSLSLLFHVLEAELEISFSTYLVRHTGLASLHLNKKIQKMN